MADWDFESALKEYFGVGATEDGRPTTEDGDAPPGVAPHGPAGSAGGSATFSAPSGWDFDKALNDYFGGVNGYVAPRGYESPDAGTRRNTPWEFSPPSEPPPPPSDYDQAVWFNALQRRHDAWDQAREQQELLRAPRGYFAPRGYEFPDAGSIGAPENFGLRHPGLVPPLPPGTPTTNEWGVSYPVVTPGTKPEGIINRWLGNFLPTPEEEELQRRLPWWGIGSIPYGARFLGNLLEPVGAAHELARQNVPGVGGFEDYILPGLWSLALGGGLDQQKRIYEPAFQSLSDEDQKTILSAQQRGEYAPPMTGDEQARLSAALGRLGDKMQELRALDTRSIEERVRDAHEAYARETPLPAQVALGFIDPGYWALGLAGRGIVSGAKALAGKAAGEGGLAERLKPVLSGIKPHRLPGTGAPGALEEALPKVGDTRPTARGEVILQPSNNVKENLALANQSRGVVERGVRELEREVPGFKYVGARVKANMERIGQKVSKQPPNTISDYLGVRGSVETLEQIDPVIERLDKRFGMVQVDPFLSEPRQSGYFGVHVQIKTPNGLTAEVQILPREVAEVKEAADELYSIRRGLDVSTEDYQRLLAEEKEIFAGATRKFRERTGITDQDLVRIERELKLRYSHLLPRK